MMMSTEFGFPTKTARTLGHHSLKEKSCPFRERMTDFRHFWKLLLNPHQSESEVYWYFQASVPCLWARFDW
jgi:hypothetical protein